MMITLLVSMDMDHRFTEISMITPMYTMEVIMGIVILKMVISMDMMMITLLVSMDMDHRFTEISMVTPMSIMEAFMGMMLHTMETITAMKIMEIIITESFMDTGT